MNYTLSHSDNTSFLTLTGKLTPWHIDDLRAVFMVLLANDNHAVVNFDEVTAVAPVCLQVVCVAIRTAKSLGKNIILRRRHTGSERQDIAASLNACSRSCTHSFQNCCTLELLRDGMQQPLAPRAHH